MVKATAPGKIILFGEHAVVYGRPAIALPLSQVRATASIQPNPSHTIRLVAPDLGTDTILEVAESHDAVALAVRLVQQEASLERLPPMIITVTSEIPIASGLGSGAAIAAAVIRALATFLGLEQQATDRWVSDLTYEVEKIHHGTPSGIDNTVVVYERPVYFVRRQPQNIIETFKIAQPLHLLVADTGVHSSTKVVVSDVRRQWQAERERFEQIFDGCGEIALAAREAIGHGDQAEIGRLMTYNQELLVEMTVSSTELDRLVAAALDAGALGAKLSGGGRGGNMIALATPHTEQQVAAALARAGARSVLHSKIA